MTIFNNDLLMTLLKSKRELFIFLTFTESLQSVQIYEQKRSNIFTIFIFNSEHSCSLTLIVNVTQTNVIISSTCYDMVHFCFSCVGVIYMIYYDLFIC